MRAAGAHLTTTDSLLYQALGTCLDSYRRHAAFALRAADSAHGTQARSPRPRNARRPRQRWRPWWQTRLGKVHRPRARPRRLPSAWAAPWDIILAVSWSCGAPAPHSVLRILTCRVAGPHGAPRRAGARTRCGVELTLTLSLAPRPGQAWLVYPPAGRQTRRDAGASKTLGTSNGIACVLFPVLFLSCTRSSHKKAKSKGTTAQAARSAPAPLSH